jgi:hypothetical protein
MGFMDKLKNIFKKKDKADKPAAEKAAKPAKAAPAAASRVNEFKGEGKVADALRNGAKKIDERVAAGLIDEKRANMIMAGLKAVEASDGAEDAKLIEIAQVIGSLYL